MPLQYRFVLFTEGRGWTELRGYSTANTFTWTPTASDTGRHLIQVWIRSNGSTAAYEGWLNTAYFDIQ